MMRRRPPGPPGPAPAPAPPAAYAPVLGAGFQATTSRVQEMHQAIAGNTFDSLQVIPGLSLPTLLVRSVHDAIAQGVYAAVRHTGSATTALAGEAERLATDPARVPGPKEQSLRSALNGAFGDTLARSGSALSVQMGLHDDLGVFDLEGEAPARLRARVCVFLHGLGCDEHSWRQPSNEWATSAWAGVLPAGEAPRYGALLAHEAGVSAIFLRYNSGQAIDLNAQAFADLMERLAVAAPQVREWVLIGHSMGGLVARRAHALASEAGLGWARCVSTIICLGSPHQGAPLAKVGHLVSAALATTAVTRPLARIAESRSRGIKDLRRGLAANTAPSPRPTTAEPAAEAARHAPALRLVFGTLAAAGTADGGVGRLLAHWFGDGLVQPGSAADDGASGDVQRVELAGLGHMSLLNHPRVYAVIRGWLGVPAG